MRSANKRDAGTRNPCFKTHQVKRKLAAIVLLLPLASLSISGIAAGLDEDVLFGLCPPLPTPPLSTELEQADLMPGTAEIVADEADLQQDALSTFRGNVKAVQGDQALSSDILTYDKEDEIIDAKGNVKYLNRGVYWSGKRAWYNRTTERARFERGDYQLLGRRGRGSARVLALELENDIARLKDVTYTTCPDAVPDWSLWSNDIKLDQAADRGRATHVVLKVKNVPVFYFPYLSFPLSDKRKSGLLPPTFGTTDDSGIDIGMPYYWNIAPNQDATFTPRVLSKRGAMLGGQYRYLTHRGSGQLDFEYLPSDNELDNQDRALVGVELSHNFAPGWYTNIDASWVSDEQYFEDLGNSLSLASTRFLERRGDIVYGASNWYAFGRVQDWQSVDPSLPGSSQPYKRLPQLYFTTVFPERNRALNYQLRSEAVYFDRDDSVVGGRIDIEPEISYPMFSAGSFLIPSLKLQHTHYLLDETGSGDNTIGRTLPILSLDGGLVFEKDFGFSGTNFIHTVEPRVFYLYVPDSGQRDIPVFDTGEYDVSYNQLFLDDRFNGPDRVGDANQVSVGLTTRFINRETGLEHLRGRIGQAFHFQERDVFLPGGMKENDAVSETIAEVSSRVTRNWSAHYAVQWDSNENITDKNAAYLRYLGDNGTIFNAGYRYRRASEVLEQTDVSARWPVTPAISLLGRWNFSLDPAQTLETVGGLEYNSCCWGVRALFRRFIRNAEGEFDNTFYLQFELKGLGSIGQKTAKFLKRRIPGYENEF